MKDTMIAGDNIEIINEGWFCLHEPQFLGNLIASRTTMANSSGRQYIPVIANPDSENNLKRDQVILVSILVGKEK